MKEFVLDASGQQRLWEYFDRIGEVLGDEARRASYAVYAMGLLGDGDRKSMEPISARSDPDTGRVTAQHPSGFSTSSRTRPGVTALCVAKQRAMEFRR